MIEPHYMDRYLWMKQRFLELCNHYNIDPPEVIGLTHEDFDEISPDWVHFMTDLDIEPEQHVRQVFIKWLIHIDHEMIPEIMIDGINTNMPYKCEEKKKSFCDVCMVPIWRGFKGGI